MCVVRAEVLALCVPSRRPPLTTPAPAPSLAAGGFRPVANAANDASVEKAKGVAAQGVRSRSRCQAPLPRASSPALPAALPAKRLQPRPAAAPTVCPSVPAAPHPLRSWPPRGSGALSRWRC